MSMKKVREEVDAIDKELVILLAKRQKCIEKAALVKNDESLIFDQERIDQVLNNIKNLSKSYGLSSEISDPIWRKLIELSIEHEFTELQKIQLRD
ncbi:MAG: hypothetical protein CBC38_01600 [Gammaproteobacteria bacterium TMED78]|nr:MAG: hypothetical protein CBC38_01600 [Gammaproteobacteria bacterium TMED78]|tara:strand:+ start:446 stop:730 length:285 start_codon:yes stop_codon:yes gene_type:complete